MKISTTSQRLKYIMNVRGLKQIDILRLAEPYCKKYEVKLNRNDLSQYVNGKVEPGRTKLYILGKTLNVSEAWLMGYDVPMIDSSPADRLREAMEKQDISAGRLAEMTGISRDQIDKYLCGDDNFSREDLIAICNELHINEAWILGHQYLAMERKPPATAGCRYVEQINNDYIQALCTDETEDSDLRIILKIAQTISVSQRKKLREIAQIMFPDSYDQ